MSDAQSMFRGEGTISRRHLRVSRHVQVGQEPGLAMPPIERTPHLFSCWESVSLLIREAEEIGLFVDFDGTLVDFRPRPNLVRMPAATRVALRELASHPRVHTAIVSGRRRATLARLIRTARVKYMGLYGWEDRSGQHIPKRVMARLLRIRKALRDLPGKLPGIYLEDKHFSLAIHSRGVSDHTQKAARTHVKKLLRGFRDFHVLRGEHIWEIVPRQIPGKGTAMRTAMANAQKGLLPVYVGDDLTDEPAFAALSRGITVLVGPARPTKARFRLRNPNEVRIFLQRLEAELP